MKKYECFVNLLVNKGGIKGNLLNYLNMSVHFYMNVCKRVDVYVLIHVFTCI